MTAPLFTFRGIEISFGEIKILRNLELSLYPAKCILLTGINGSGKSTLLKIMAGLEKPAKAQIEISGKSHSWKQAMRSIQKEIIYLHQQPFLFSGTVESNVAYGLRFTSLNREQRKESVKKALEWANLSALAKRQAHTLSGGVQQRVAFTRAWILEPKVLLLDEPVSNMDQESREQACLLMQRMKSAGMSIVITSHVPQYFDGLADIQYELTEGQLVQ